MYIDSLLTFTDTVKKYIWTITDDKLVINTYERENPHQKWTVRDHKVVNDMLDGMVLDIADASEEEGALILPQEYSEGDSQHWDFEYM